MFYFFSIYFFNNKIEQEASPLLSGRTSGATNLYCYQFVSFSFFLFGIWPQRYKLIFKSQKNIEI